MMLRMNKTAPSKQDENLFSSETEMIANPVIKSTFWIIGFIVIIGNTYVIVSKIAFVKRNQIRSVSVFQHVILLNISIADFIMGVYLLTTAAFSIKFSEFYGSVDREWRSSLKCSIVGSLSVLSSQASCFFMVALTALRLLGVFCPVKSLSASLRPWKVSVLAIWLLSLSLSIAPILKEDSPYFVHTISFSSRYHQNRTMNFSEFKKFMCRYAVLNNTAIKDSGNELQSVVTFLRSLPDSEPVRTFGYYGETSVCMPRFYVGWGEKSWGFTIFLITINFCCFLFIAISYILIYRHSTKSAKKIRSNRSGQQNDAMQKRIARIIATDFCCWIPICIMAYVRLGVGFSNIVYQISAAILLPINSALNPFLFSSLPDKLMEFYRSKLRKCCKPR